MLILRLDYHHNYREIAKTSYEKVCVYKNNSTLTSYGQLVLTYETRFLMTITYSEYSAERLKRRLSVLYCTRQTSDAII